MAIGRRRAGPRKPHEVERRSDRDDERRPDGEREQRPERARKHGGDDPAKHAAIIARRWQGSAPPSSERYALALQQWHALPGAVAWPATDVTAAPADAAAPDTEPKT